MTKKVSRFAQWWTRFTNFEFWSFDVFYFPVKIYYAFLALRSRSLFFFTASNPSIEFGGMLGEKKSEIFDLIPDEFMPVTRLFAPDVSTEKVMNYLQQAKLSFPVIAKPDVGERGWMVSKLNSEEELSAYLNDIQVNFLIQEFVDSRMVDPNKIEDILTVLMQQYDPEKAARESGLIRIRFIVNCKGETGRFRVLAMNPDYQEKAFDESITSQLLTITKGLNGWKPKEFRGTVYDYYQYLIFKIQDGKIVKILP